MYKKLNQREHVLARPGMYVGSMDPDEYNTWVYDPSACKIVKKNVKIIPALYKLFDEIIVNAIDHVTRMKLKYREKLGENVHLVKTIKINIDKKTGEISVFNDGSGIDVFMHPEYNVYIPELIFGHLLTSTNYDDNRKEEEKIIGGQNGIGAKACNIFSQTFTIETVDASRQLSYTQTFSENMLHKTKPVVRKSSKKPFTKISFVPDYKRLMRQKVEENTDAEQDTQDKLDEDTYQLFLKRCMDVCALTDADVTVWVNDEKLDYKTFEKYVDLYLGPKTDRARVSEVINDRWEMVVSHTDTIGMEQVSFVNGLWTIRGGKHVDYIVNQLCNKMVEAINKKRKNSDVKTTHIKNYLMVFLKCTINNPSFDSQTKDVLTTPQYKFGSKADVPDRMIEKLYKSGELVEKALNLSDKNMQAQNKKTDGKKQNKIRGLAKLDDANWAGTSRSQECVLILTEGDSAKTMALEGLAEVGRDKYGVFPLRGKLLNVKDVADKKLVENKEIQDIKKILGLESGRKYTDISDLRYGQIMLMVDQDSDGSHIRGLLMNMFQTLWPTLLEKSDFIVSMVTPIVKVTRTSGSTGQRGESKSFYNLMDYQKWAKEEEEKNTLSQWKIKYYKGLGTSNDQEAKEYFRNMHIVRYAKNTSDNIHALFDLAFNKKFANARKKWLGKYDPDASIFAGEDKIQTIPFSDFFHKELIHFSVYDTKRSIPNVIDGLKPSQRKVLYSCFKRNLTQECKVSQLAGYVSEHAAYHHGEASLQATIVGMAQDFVGSNNIQLLMPNGMFGSRNLGGKDAAQSRYIYTQLESIAFKIFPKDDNKLLTYLNDDGFPIEPEYYVPIIPFILVNGALGIGTAYSTNIPSFNPLDIINVMRLMIRDRESLPALKPWYRGFSGRVDELVPNKSYASVGTYTRTSKTTVAITELPIGTWTEDYKNFLETFSLENPKVLKNIESHSAKNVHFILHFAEDALDKLLENQFEATFHLVNKNINLTNMHAFNEKGVIQKYDQVKDILHAFYDLRMRYYIDRKKQNIQDMEHKRDVANAKAAFIRDVMRDKIQIMKTKRQDVESQLQKLGYPTFQDPSGPYDYLLKMQIYSFTEERYKALLKDVEDLTKMLHEYGQLKESDIWWQELDALEKEYVNMLDVYMQKQNANATCVASKRKTTKRRV